MRRITGFSLIEVLISIVILSVALLGTAGLMGSSLRNTNTAYYRSQATVLADDILDRMRANVIAARSPNRHYDIGVGPVYVAPAGNNMARYDAEEWVAMLEETLPGGVGIVAVDADGIAEITIRWDDVLENSFTTQSQL